MNLGTFITGAIVVCIAAIALWRVLNGDKKSCCGDCAGCESGIRNQGSDQ